MITVAKSVEAIRSAAKKIAEASRWLAAKTVEATRNLHLKWRTSRFVRKFSWRSVFRTAGMGLALSLFGMVVGVLAALAPPVASLGTMGIPIVLLVWASPELRRVPTKIMSRAFYCYVFILACVPYYYAVQIPGLPWLTIRRLFVFSLLGLFFVSVAGSAQVRARIREVLSANRSIYVCFVGYVAICFASIFTAKSPDFSFSQFMEFSFNWFIPACVCVYVVQSIEDVRKLLRFICIFFLIVTGIGVLNFVGQHNYMIDLIPRFIYNSMISSYPVFAEIVNSNYFRNGLYRSSSIFVEPLSYGENAALVAPLGGYFLMHGEKLLERWLGAIVIIAAMVSLFVSGARGGSVSFILSMPILFALWVVRYARANPVSMIGPLGGAIAMLASTSLIGAVFFVGKLHRMVLGGGDTASSDMTRIDQAKLALPKIIANPITGHGIGNAPDVIGFYSPGGKLSVDTSILTLLVETGIPGFLLFYGLIVLGAFIMSKLYIMNNDRESAPGAAIACSFIAYGIYRLVLSQRENQWLFFILVGVAAVILKIVADRAKKTSPETVKATRSPGRDRIQGGIQGARPASVTGRVNI